MMSRLFQFAGCLAVLPALLPAGASRPAPRFDGARAYEDLRQIVSIGPRPAGSAALQTTRLYIRKQLEAAGVAVVEEPFDARTPLGPVKMVNLIGRIPGREPGRLVIGGHYDTKLYREFRFVGANDAGSSAAFLIELGRALKTRQNRLAIDLVFFDGEEAMLPDWGPGDHTYGSEHYVEAARRQGVLSSIKAMILVDMIGDRDLQILREQASTRWLIDVIWAAARRLNLSDVFGEQVMDVADDHVPFLEAGIPAVDLIDFTYPPWHTAGDTLDKVSARSLQVVGDVVVEALPAIEDRILKGTRPAR